MFVLLKAYHYTTKTTILKKKKLYEPYDCRLQIILRDLQPKEVNHNIDTVLTMKR